MPARARAPPLAAAAGRPVPGRAGLGLGLGFGFPTRPGSFLNRVCGYGYPDPNKPAPRLLEYQQLQLLDCQQL